MDNNFHNQLEHQITKEIIKGALYNQKMGELHNNIQSTPLQGNGNYYYEPLRNKKYKGQIVLYVLLNFVGIAFIILIALLFVR